MKSHGLPVLVGISFVALAALLVGCPVNHVDTYEDGTPYTPGGSTASGEPSGSGGAGTGGTGGGNGGAGGCNCEPAPCRKCGDNGCEDAPEANGMSCSDDMSKVCYEGECLLMSGQSCDADEKCASGICANGVCCEQECNTKCKACNIPGMAGTCNFLPKGWPDGDCTENGCDGFSGMCVMSGLALGSPCDVPAQCNSNICVAGICRLDKGQPCSDPVQCASNYCVSNKCAETPENAALCHTGAKGGTTCSADSGEPCGDEVSCKMGYACDSGICRAKNGTSCTSNYQCVTNFCMMSDGGMGSCAGCTGIADACGVNVACGGMGKCPSEVFPEGAYCIDDTYCIKGLICTGFPRKCAP